MTNSPEYLEALFGIWHGGYVAVPVNARLHRDEIAYIVDDSNAAVVITDTDHTGDVESLVGTVATLKAAGLGDFTPGDNLFLRQGINGKDARRAAIAQRYCVVAMAGDQLGDFSDLFGAIASSADRRRATDAGAIGEMWGNGWFVLPNPVYGTGLKGGFDEVFPADKRWVDGGAR